MLREQAKFFWDDAWGPNPVGSGPTSTIQASAAVTGVSTAAQAGTPANIPAAPQTLTLSSSAPAASQADGTHVSSDTGSAAASDAGSAETAALQSLTHSHASDSLPFSTPAADSSDGGQAGGFDIAAGDFSTDWFVV